MVVFIGGTRPLRFRERIAFDTHTVDPIALGAMPGDVAIVFTASFTLGAMSDVATPAGWGEVFNTTWLIGVNPDARARLNYRRLIGSEGPAQFQPSGMQGYGGELLLFEGGSRDLVAAGSAATFGATATLPAFLGRTPPLIVLIGSAGNTPHTLSHTPSTVDQTFNTFPFSGRQTTLKFKLFGEADFPVDYTGIEQSGQPLGDVLKFGAFITA